MDVTHQLVSIFVEIDDFCKQLENYENNFDSFLLSKPSAARGPKRGLSDSEIATILIAFHSIRFRDFKTFYLFLKKYFHNYFPALPSYQRFVELIKYALFPVVLFLQFRKGKQTGIYYIDSTALPVCLLKRRRRHKTFDNIAEYGKTSVGWFFGLKLHIVINETGQLMAFKITKGNVHEAKAAEPLLSKFKGVAFGDKGYLGKKLFEKLFENGLKLITRKRKNMKEKINLNAFEQQLLNQRNIIETVIDHLKNHYQIWHSRHRSIFNAFVHLLAGLAAYSIEPLRLYAIKSLEETPN